MSFLTNYIFNPDDTIWVVNAENQTVKKGKCLQVNINIYQDYAFVLSTGEIPTVDHLIYLVLIDGEISGTFIDEDKAFPTLQTALNALEVLINV